MPTEKIHTLMLQNATIDLNSTGDKQTFRMPFVKQEVRRIGLKIKGTVSGTATVAFSTDAKMGATARDEAAVGTITVPSGDNQGEDLYEEPSSRVTLNSEDEVVVDVTAETFGGACLAVPYIIIEEIPERPANNSQMTAV